MEAISLAATQPQLPLPTTVTLDLGEAWLLWVIISPPRGIIWASGDGAMKKRGGKWKGEGGGTGGTEGEEEREENEECNGRAHWGRSCQNPMPYASC